MENKSHQRFGIITSHLVPFEPSSMKKQRAGNQQPRHVAKVTDLSAAEILSLLQLARDMKDTPVKYHKVLHRRSLIMLFEKPSLRTRVSFEVGMTQLGGHALFYQVNEELQGKKESLADTSRVLSRYGDFIMARVKSRQQIRELQKYATVPVINGLDDYAHPCQILTDLFSIAEKKNLKTASDWKSLTLSYLGDIRNNVTYDLMRAASLLGFSIRVAGPKGSKFQIEDEVLAECSELCAQTGGRVTVLHDAVEAVRNVDVIYTDSWMSYGIPENEKIERLSALQPFQVTKDLISYAKKDVLFMNCLPALRGMEQTTEVIDGPHSIVFDQAENRNHAQKALLVHLLGMAPTPPSSRL